MFRTSAGQASTERCKQPKHPTDLYIATPSVAAASECLSSHLIAVPSDAAYGEGRP